MSEMRDPSPTEDSLMWELGRDPFQQFSTWLADAENAKAPQPNAFCLSTSDRHGLPSARMVLLKDHSHSGFVFYTNRQSRKGQQIEERPHVAMVFWWPQLNRQVRIEGRAVAVPDSESDQYFAARDRDSQLGAWASHQSRELTGRIELLKRLDSMRDRFPEEVPRPHYWGGFRVVPDRIEFYQGRDHRLNDRVLYRRENGGQWNRVVLAP